MTTIRAGRTVIAAAAAIATVGILPGGALAQAPWQLWSEVAPVAVLLFSNYTGTSRAVDTVMPRVYWELDVRKARYVSHTELRPVLRRHRIRSLGGLTAEDAAAIRRETGAGLLLLGTLDIFQEEDIVEVAVSARVVAIDDMEVIAAESVAATNEDFAGMFGIGRIASAEELAGRLVTSLFDGLERGLVTAPGDRSRAVSVAVIPFGNTSDHWHAGDAVASILTSALLERGYRVAEPGRVRGLALEDRKVLRGGIGHPMLERLADELNVDFVVTGEVATFRIARGDLNFATPALSFGARLVDARERRLVLAADEFRDGRDGEFILGLGRTFSLGRLTRDAAAKLVRNIERRAPHDFAQTTYEGRTP